MKRNAWCIGLLLLSSTAFAASPASFDWPQWQGPNRDAVSKETGLLKEWPKDGPPLAWKIKGLGGGYSAPSVAAGRIYGMSNQGGKEVVWALNEMDGETAWTTPIGSALSQAPSQGREGPGCTPTVDGDRLFVIGNTGELACLQVSDGKIVWHLNFASDLGGRSPSWSYRESPLIDGDKLICTPGGTDATIVALDKSNGKTIWKCQVPDGAGGGGGPPGGPGRGPGGPGGPGGRGGRGGGRGGFGGMGGGSGAAYASVIAIDFGGQRQYVQLTSKALVGVSTADGKLLWRYDKPANRNGINITTPLYLGDGLVFAASAYGAGGGLVKLTKDGDGGIKAEEVWFSHKMENHHGGVIVTGGALYGANGGNGGGHLVCLDFKTGNVRWEESQAPKGSIALADGRLYYRTEDGLVLLIEPNADKYVERGRFEQPDRSNPPAWSHPVIANGKLYIRDQDVLLCYDVKAK